MTASAVPASGLLPLNVTLTGSVSGGTAPYALLWDFGDGFTATGNDNPSHVFIVSHVYKFLGNFTAQFAVHDSGPFQNQKSVSITVNPVAGLLIIVVDKSNSPVARATVRMVSGPAGQQLLTLPTNSSGLANFTRIAAGFYSIEAAASGFVTNTTTVVASPGSPMSYTVVLSPPAASGGSPFPTIPLIVAFAAVFVSLALLRRFRRTRRSVTANPEKPRGRSPRQQLLPRTLRGTL